MYVKIKVHENLVKLLSEKIIWGTFSFVRYIYHGE